MFYRPPSPSSQSRASFWKISQDFSGFLSFFPPLYVPSSYNFRTPPRHRLDLVFLSLFFFFLPHSLFLFFLFSDRHSSYHERR